MELTFDPNEERRSFYEVEIDYLTAIRDNPLHIIHNKFGEQKGYIGVSASVELGYAIIHQVPVVMLYEPELSSGVPTCIRRLVANNTDSLFIQRIDRQSNAQLLDFLHLAAASYPGYVYTLQDELEVQQQVSKLLENYKNAL